MELLQDIFGIFLTTGCCLGVIGLLLGGLDISLFPK